MEGKRSSLPPAPSDSHSGKNSISSSSSSKSSSPSPSSLTGGGLFSSVFAAPSSVRGREQSGCDIFGPYRKQDTAGGLWDLKPQSPDGISHAGLSKEINLSNKDGKSAFQGDKTDPCSLSSSLYYGGQDFCKLCDSRNNASSYNHSYTNDGEDNSGGPAIDSRGDWWQGSLYY